MTDTIDVAALVERAHQTLPGITTPSMRGDNLAIVLCSYFDNPDETAEDDNGWTPSAIAAYDEIIAAIREHYATALQSQADALAEARRELAEARLTIGRLYEMMPEDGK